MKNKSRNIETFLLLPFALCLLTYLTFAQTLAPGAPGKDAQWATAGKQGVGTSASLESKVWFTLAQGVLTEVYYPDVTTANVHLLQFVVVNPKTRKVETEQDDTNHSLLVNGNFPQNFPPILKSLLQEKRTELNFSKNNREVNALNFNQINVAKNNKWIILKSYITDPNNDSVMMRIRFLPRDKNLQLYVYYDPSLANSGMRDTAWNDGETLISQDKDISSALISSSRLTEISNGFYQTSDGLEQLKSDGKIVTSYARAENGNVVQLAKVDFERGKEIDFVLSFGKTPVEAAKTAKDSLAKGFDKTFSQYSREWSNYVKTLPNVEPKYQAQFNMAAMILRAHEDKTHRGANIASLTVPWGGGANANENNIGGYHLVWSRDLYQVATAFMALGDTDAANRALDFLFNVQQKADGSFPQNSYLDGKPFWGSLQMDEVAYPLILAYQLKRFDKNTWENHVKRAADFIVKNGPRTPQERWEEEAGYSPSTIAAEIAGLVCAAEIARKNGDEASAIIYLAAADDWARNVERWTATTTGKYADGIYYLRITNNGNPDAGDKIELNNGAGFYDERDVVDAGFLELVRLGIKSPGDPLIQKSLKVIDKIIKVDTPKGAAFYRYNHDGYGEMDDGRRWNFDGKYTGKGRLWTLLSGERGQYELALKSKVQSSESKVENPLLAVLNPQSRLDAMLNFANEGLMIPEQIWDSPNAPKTVDNQFVPELEFGEGTGSATPLAWSMAQFIRLAVNLRAGKNLDTPDVVYNRYARNGVPPQASDLGGTDTEIVLPPEKAGEIISFPRRTQPNTKIAYSGNGETYLKTASEKGEVIIEFKMPTSDMTGVLGAETPDGATAFERVQLLTKPNVRELPAALVEKIKTASASPIIENDSAILFYRGAAKRVEVAGDMTGWNPGQILMREIGENLYAVRLKFAPTARVEYKLIVDGNWTIDPLNPRKIDNGVGGENSFLTMPDYQPTKYFDEAAKLDSAAAPLEEVKIDSKIYGKRIVKVYVPPSVFGRESAAALPVLYVQDGTDYINRAKAVQIQENLVKAGKVAPFIMVFIDYKDRMKEYWAADDYARFLATEIVPAIDAKFKTIKNRAGRAILGASLGGVTSVWAALKYPEIFSRVGGQSPSFWIDNQRVIKELAEINPQKVKYRFYFDDGALEGVENARRVNVLLRGKNFDVTYIETEAGHNWTAWRDRLANAFVALWK